MCGAISDSLALLEDEPLESISFHDEAGMLRELHNGITDAEKANVNFKNAERTE